jgi:hypothetical protein
VEDIHLLTSSDDRATEVKAFGMSARGNDLRLETRQGGAHERSLHIYVVDNVRQGNLPPSDSLTFTATCWPPTSNGRSH